MKILDRYLGYIILQYTLITMLVLLGLFTFVTFIDQLSSLGKGNYGLPEAITYVILVIPRIIYELFPMAALLGTIIGLSMLANDSELIVMRASGVSILQITSAALKMGGLFVIVAILIGELVSPYTETQAQRGRAEALQEDIKQHTNFGLWMRDSSTYVNIGEVLPDLTLLKLKVFEFDQNRKLRSLVFSEKGQFQGDYWLLERVRQTLVDTDGNTEILKTKAAKWDSRVTPQILSVFLIKPEQLSFLQLSRYINHLNENQQKTDPYELAFWNKIMLPLSTAVMVVLAVPFVFTNVRSGTLGRNLFIGIMLGIGFYVANRGFGYFVLANEMPPLLGATIPVIAFLILAMIMMRRVE
jgi:lipopolysaccharide export system permease protein